MWWRARTSQTAMSFNVNFSNTFPVWQQAVADAPMHNFFDAVNWFAADRIVVSSASLINSSQFRINDRQIETWRETETHSGPFHAQCTCTLIALPTTALWAIYILLYHSAVVAFAVCIFSFYGRLAGRVYGRLWWNTKRAIATTTTIIIHFVCFVSIANRAPRWILKYFCGTAFLGISRKVRPCIY